MNEGEYCLYGIYGGFQRSRSQGDNSWESSLLGMSLEKSKQTNSRRMWKGRKPNKGAKSSVMPEKVTLAQSYGGDLEAVRSHLRIVLWNKGTRAFILLYWVVPRGHKFSGTSVLLISHRK